MQNSYKLSAKSFLQELTYGFFIPFRALDLIFSNRKLILLSILPVVLSFLILGSLLYVSITTLGSWAATAFQAWMSGMAGVLMHIAIIIVSIFLIYCCIQLMGFILSLVSSPFNDLLSSRTEKILVPSPQIESSGGANEWLGLLFLDLRKTIICIFFLAIFTLGLFVPILNIVSFLGIALLNTFTFVTYPQNRRKMGLLFSLNWIKENLGASLGFGIITSLLLSAPVINLFALPIAVIGGTILFLRK